MIDTIGVLPSGNLYCEPFANDGTEKPTDPPISIDVQALFVSKNVGEALFSLTVLNGEQPLSPSVHFWREFACQYMTERCHSKHSDRAIEDSQKKALLHPIQPLGIEIITSLLAAIPPMKGAEYLSANVLQDHWMLLDDWLRQTVASKYINLEEFLKACAPRWHQVGRVCFHLAENKTDLNYPFAFMATYSPTYDGRNSRHLPLAQAMQEYAGNLNKAQLIHLLSPIDFASKSSSLVKDLVDSGDLYHPLAWSSDEAYQFLKEVPLFEKSGIITRLPDWWKKRPRPKVGATLSTATKETLNIDSMLQFNMQVAIGDDRLSDEELADLLATAGGLMLVKGHWVEVDKEKLLQAMSQMQALENQAAMGGLSFAEGMRLLAGASVDLSDNINEQELVEWAFVKADDKLSEILKNIRTPENLRSALPEHLLKAKLRPYQQIGVNWLWYLNQLGLGACLADDMGLGKTIQIISLLLILKKNQKKRPSLLVLPTSLMGNWKNELKKFAPSLNVTFVHPSIQSRKQLKEMAEQKKFTNIDLVVTTYGMLLRQEWLQTISWQLVVLDEAQAIKNPGSQQTKAVKTLNALSKIVLTGTPVENRLSDLWSLFDFINPGLLGSASRFKSFSQSLAKRKTEQYAPLRHLVQPYILRRMKTDKSIISDLPDKTEVYAYCGLTKQQAALYQDSVNELKYVLSNEEGIKRRGLILAYLTRFKQICNHPSQHLSDGRYLPAHSGKFSRLAEICEEISSRQEKVLIFTQYKEMCEPIADFLSKIFKQAGLVLHGGVSSKNRQQMVDEFQTEQGSPFFVLSIKAGGTGLNLTAASHVIHFDRWWNPAVENQASDRAFRIGQKKNVLIHKFVCLGTIEEKIDVIISEKSAMANELLEGNSQVKLTEMNDKELLNLVSLDIEQASI